MFYYKILDEDGNFLNIASSSNLRYYVKGNMCACMEEKAQYIYLDGQYYRVCWLNPEPSEIKGTIPLIGMAPIDKDEYLKIKEKQEKEKLEQK